jgi:diguanylate cyclase (GGDEF)-like protein
MTQHDPTLLLVSDDATVCDHVERAATPEHSLLICGSAEDAFETLGRESISLVLLDGHLASVEAWQFAERMRRLHPGIDLALLADDFGVEEDDLREGWLIGVVPRTNSLRAMRHAIDRLVEGIGQVREIAELKSTLHVLERCRRLASCLEPGRVYPLALDIILDLLSRNRGGAVFQLESVPMSEGVAFRGFGESESLFLRDLLLEDKSQSEMVGDQIEILSSGPYVDALREVGVSTEKLLLVPLKGQTSEAGELWLLEDGREFEEHEIDLVRVVVEHAVTALVNSERYQHAKERAFIDDVTEVYNARYLLATTETEIRRAHRYEKPLSVLFLDLDRFKLVNDRHGHLIGSQVLRSLSQVLMQSVRDVDTLARYGGDEFTILLVDTDHGEATAIAERIRRTVEEHVFEASRGGSLRLTVSLGVGTYPQHGSERNTLLDASDKAMYRAKSLGRNRVCSADELSN